MGFKELTVGEVNCQQTVERYEVRRMVSPEEGQKEHCSSSCDAKARYNFKQFLHECCPWVL